MKLRIVSDGTNAGTRVEDELGNRIEGVIAVDWTMRVGELSRATIEIRNVEFKTVWALPKEKPHYRIKQRMIRLCVNEIVADHEETTLGELIT